MYIEQKFPYRKPDYFSFKKLVKAVATGGISLITDKAKSTATAATNAAQTAVQAANDELVAQQEALQQAQERLAAQQSIIKQYEQISSAQPLVSSAQTGSEPSTSTEKKSNLVPILIVAAVVIGLVLIFKKK